MAKTLQTPQQATPFYRQRIVVIAVSAAAMLVAGLLAWFLWKAFSVWAHVPVREVIFVNAASTPNAATPFTHLKTEELARVARAVATVKVNLLRVDLNEVKAAVEQVEWVRHADVRRRLPGKIEVSIEEHIPYGLWRAADKAGSGVVVPLPTTQTGTGADLSAAPVVASETITSKGYLINNFGEVFKATLPVDLQSSLPTLGGPTEASKEVIVAFDQFKKQLSQIDRVPREVQLSVRRAWTIKLDNNMSLELGRNDAESRLTRFMSAYTQLPDLQTAGIHVDLRYPTGLAVRRSSSLKQVSNVVLPKSAAAIAADKAKAAAKKAKRT